MNSRTSTSLLTWHAIYGGYAAKGYVYDYLVVKDPYIGWIALHHPAAISRSGPYAVLPFGRMRTRREARRLAEEFERKNR
jgi:hypothetical protein